MDWIALATMLITAFATISSIVIALSTLKQNNKMIEESTRPNIQIYKDIFNFTSPVEYLVIKNFGKSTAKIDNIIFDKESLKSISFGSITCDLTFENLVSSSLAPNQSYKIPIKTDKNNNKIIEIEVFYSNVKSYHEKFVINLIQDRKIPMIQQQSANKDNMLRDLSHGIQELTKHIS